MEAKMADLPTFSTFADLNSYIEKEGDAGLQRLRELAASDFHRSDLAQQMYIREWLVHHDNLEAKRYAEEARELTRRNVAAAEDAASAARESAKTSGQSARAAMFAAFVSFLAFVVSVAAYIRAV
jgi:hypothetical protein